MPLFVPERRRGDRELLDHPAVDAQTRLSSIGDVVQSNRLFGGRRAAVAAVEGAMGATRTPVTVLDVGTGLADIPAEIARRAQGRGVTVTTIGLDESGVLLTEARRKITHAVCGNIRALPFRDASVDIVLCSQLLHHFDDHDVGAIIAELDRVARLRVVIADLQRNSVAAAGFWLASFALAFHSVTRHDGVVSVLKGFTAAELRRAVVDSVRTEPSIDRWLGFRLTASWTPRHSR